VPSIDINKELLAFIFFYSAIVKHTETISDLVSGTNENARYKWVSCTC